MLVNSRKVNYRFGTVCLALMAVLALSSCKKTDEPSGSNATPGGESSAPANSTNNSTKISGNKNPTPSFTSSSKNSAALPPEVEKLGVKPTGTDCPTSAPIKGNLRKTRKIYHEAKSKNYKDVKPEICFKDVTTAKQAGFEAPKGAKQ